LEHEVRIVVGVVEVSIEIDPVHVEHIEKLEAHEWQEKLPDSVLKHKRPLELNKLPDGFRLKEAHVFSLCELLEELLTHLMVITMNLRDIDEFKFDFLFNGSF
jgi:hypothetical protein